MELPAFVNTSETERVWVASSADVPGLVTEADKLEPRGLMGGNFAPEPKRLLSESGCEFERHGKGDQDIWFSQHTGVRFPVDQKIKSRHTANAVLKQAGLPKYF